MRKDSPAVGDVHVSTALGNERPKKWRRFSAIIGQGPKTVTPPDTGSSTAKRSDALSGQPMVGVGGRTIEPYDADTFLTPMRYDPMALSYMREDQVPRILDAMTHPKRLEKTVVSIKDLTAIKNRVSRVSVTRHLKKMGEVKGRIDQKATGDHIEGRDDLKPVTVAWMNGELLLLDGHDRVVAVWLDGGDEVCARFLDVDAYDDSKPDADDQHTGAAYDLLQGADGRVLLNFKDDTLSVPFMYDPNFFVGLRPDQVPKFTFALTHQDELPDATVPLFSLVAIQNRVNADTVASKVEQGWGKPPVIVRRNGFNYIADGHDRLAAAWLKGMDTVPVKLTDITFEDNGMRPEGVAKAFTVNIQKADPDKRQVFGWMSVSTKGGECVRDDPTTHLFDKQDDMVLTEALEPAVYEYVLSSRVGGDMHVEKGVSRLIESMMFTKEKQDALGIDLGQEGWWVGYQVDSPPLWDAIKRGERPEFSIGGAAVSVPYDKWLENK